MAPAIPAIIAIGTLVSVGTQIASALEKPDDPPGEADAKVAAAKRRRAAAAQTATGRRSTLLVAGSGDAPAAPTLLGRQSGNG